MPAWGAFVVSPSMCMLSWARRNAGTAVMPKRNKMTLTVLLWAYACRHQLPHAIMHMYPCPDRREQVNNRQAGEQQLLHLCANLLTTVFFPHKQPLHQPEKDRTSFLCNVHDTGFNSSAL